MPYWDIPDHPVIHNMERTGYPDGKEPEQPICPVCGKPADTFYRDKNFKIIGCGACVRKVDAWEVA